MERNIQFMPFEAAQGAPRVIPQARGVKVMRNGFCLYITDLQIPAVLAIARRKVIPNVYVEVYGLPPNQGMKAKKYQKLNILRSVQKLVRNDLLVSFDPKTGRIEANQYGQKLAQWFANEHANAPDLVNRQAA